MYRCMEFFREDPIRGRDLQGFVSGTGDSGKRPVVDLRSEKIVSMSKLHDHSLVTLLIFRPDISLLRNTQPIPFPSVDVLGVKSYRPTRHLTADGTSRPQTPRCETTSTRFQLIIFTHNHAIWTESTIKLLENCCLWKRKGKKPLRFSPCTGNPLCFGLLFFPAFSYFLQPDHYPRIVCFPYSPLRFCSSVVNAYLRQRFFFFLQSGDRLPSNRGNVLFMV